MIFLGLNQLCILILKKFVYDFSRIRETNVVNVILPNAVLLPLIGYPDYHKVTNTRNGK